VIGLDNRRINSWRLNKQINKDMIAKRWDWKERF